MQVSRSTASSDRGAARRRLVVVLGALPLALGACAGSLPAADVATQAEDVLEEQEGVRPDITCPEDLEEEVGAQTRCTWTAGDDPTEYGLTITVTAVDGDGAEFDVGLDRQPLG